MARVVTFIFIRLLAIAWVLMLANVFEVLGPYAISIIVLASEAVFGYLWAKAETEITMCKPAQEDAKLLALLMLGTAIVETVLVFFLVGPYVLWVILWRALVSYFPFTIVEILSYERRCKLRGIVRSSQ
ncbi:hypothetical protein GF380_03900 [Candidatus Uhrbacteria bacterium]|nr:hypothetical protein [Candidatus Uhrbacteria bacterium]MBD3284237.1 hypothetical protein [Candidatus Uhrbacteria bacterium]